MSQINQTRRMQITRLVETAMRDTQRRAQDRVEDRENEARVRLRAVSCDCV
jgi:hypothetical protein